MGFFELKKSVFDFGKILGNLREIWTLEAEEVTIRKWRKFEVDRITEVNRAIENE